MLRSPPVPLPLPAPSESIVYQVGFGLASGKNAGRENSPESFEKTVIAMAEMAQ